MQVAISLAKFEAKADDGEALITKVDDLHNVLERRQTIQVIAQEAVGMSDDPSTYMPHALVESLIIGSLWETNSNEFTGEIHSLTIVAAAAISSLKFKAIVLELRDLKSEFNQWYDEFEMMHLNSVTSHLLLNSLGHFLNSEGSAISAHCDDCGCP